MDDELRVWWDEEKVNLEQVVCTANPKHQRGGKRTTNLSVVLHSSQVFDVMWTWHKECLVQQHVLNAFAAQGFNGFQIKPVQARFEHSGDSVPPRFWELIVTGWAGLASPGSGIQLDAKKSCSDCGSLVYTKATDYSRLIDETKWDGSDFFMVWPLPKFIFVTDRVREFAQKNDLRLTQFASLEHLQPKTAFEQRLKMGFSPGRLSYWMPDDRAHELGDPLGIY